MTHRRKRERRRHRSLHRDAGPHETNPHLGPGRRDGQAPRPDRRDRRPDLLRRTLQPLATRRQRELQRPPPSVLPKGSNLAVHSPTHVAHVTAELNERPRKGLGYDTPAFRFAKETASTPTR